MNSKQACKAHIKKCQANHYVDFLWRAPLNADSLSNQSLEIGLFATESGVKVNIFTEKPFPEDDGVTVPTGQRPPSVSDDGTLQCVPRKTNQNFLEMKNIQTHLNKIDCWKSNFLVLSHNMGGGVHKEFDNMKVAHKWPSYELLKWHIYYIYMFLMINMFVKALPQCYPWLNYCHGSCIDTSGLSMHCTQNKFWPVSE